MYILPHRSLHLGQEPPFSLNALDFSPFISHALLMASMVLCSSLYIVLTPKTRNQDMS